jgi:hypothetical protein
LQHPGIGVTVWIMKQAARNPIWLIGMLLCLNLVFSGCVAVAVAGGAAGGVAWVKGELQVTQAADVTRMNEAVDAACADLDLIQISKATDKLGGKFVYRNSKDEKVSIVTEYQTEEATLLKIRIGMFGDQQQSQVILDAIQAKL